MNKWEKLHAIYHNLPASNTKMAIERTFVLLRGRGASSNEALERALILNDLLVPDWASSHEMDGVKEYDDILADQAAFEALREG